MRKRRRAGQGMRPRDQQPLCQTMAAGQSESHPQNGPGGGPGGWRPPRPISSPAKMAEFIMKNETPGHTDKQDLVGKELACLL